MQDSSSETYFKPSQSMDTMQVSSLGASFLDSQIDGYHCGSAHESRNFTLGECGRKKKKKK
jgi:hypothetical protein